MSILWHGSSEKFSTFAPGGLLTPMAANWMADSAVMAAFYAGPGGYVYPVTPAEGSRILDASGFPGASPLHYLRESEIEAVKDAFGVSADGTCPGDATEAFRHVRRRMGTDPALPGPCWEGVVRQNRDNHDMNRLLQGLGFDGVMVFEASKRVWSQAKGRCENGPGEWKLALSLLEPRLFMAGGRHSVAMLDPATAMISGPAIPASEVILSHLNGEPTPKTSPGPLRRMCARWDAAQMPQAASVHEADGMVFRP